MDFSLSFDMVEAEDDSAPPPGGRERPHPEFDGLARLAASATGARGAVVSLIDEGLQWSEAHHNISAEEMPIVTAFRRRVFATRETSVIADAADDPGFYATPSVSAGGGIRFCAGIPLVASGHCIGALCVFDPAPRDGLSQEQRIAFDDLAQTCAELVMSRRLRRTGEIAAQVMDATLAAVVCVNRDDMILSWNGAAERMFGRSAGEVIGRTFDVILPTAARAKRHRASARAPAPAPAHETDGLTATPLEFLARRANGSEFPAKLSLLHWDTDIEDGGFTAIIRDISRRKAIENDRQNMRAFLDTIIANLPVSLAVKDAKTHQFLLINRAGEQLFGRPADQIIGRTIRELIPARGERYELRDNQAVASGSPLTIESAATRDDGSIVQLRTKRIVIDGPERPSQYLLSLTDDVTDVRRAEAAVNLDGLTGLINRTAYIDRLNRLVEAKTPIALLKVDLVRFRSVNDQFGHRLGDDMLAQAAERLRLVVGPADLVARVGGNEFSLLLIGSRPVDRSRALADAAIDCLAKPFLINHVTVHSGACVGIAMATDHAGAVDEFRRSAELALQRAKQQGRGSICRFDAEIDIASRDRQMLENDLRDALDAGDIALAYQPVMSVAAGRMTSVEALARWTHPVRGPIGPDVFIPLAEECGLIHRLGEQILRRACLDALAWPDDLRVAVNLSPLQFQHGDIYATICAVLADSGLAASRLQLEVTEGLLIRDVERTFVELERLRALGIHVLMDDFGVGYSSLSYFERYPFDMVKIDKSFIDGIDSSLAAKAIIKAVVGLGQDLDMGIVAEGVETEEQARLLVASGCTHLQGYLFSPPLPASAVASLATAHTDESPKIADAA